jgi:pimeloyl-ACP methyl ester carboxylesterase
MDLWDPLLIDSVAATRPVILFDNAGVGQSTGIVSDTISGMAQHVLSFLDLVEVKELDVLGFSMGGAVAQLVALNGRKGLVRKLILAGTTPSAGEGILGLNEEEQAKVVKHATVPVAEFDNAFSYLFWHNSETSQKEGRESWGRITQRGPATSGEERSQHVSYNFADGGAGIMAMSAAMQKWNDRAYAAEGSYDRLSTLDIPVFVGQGKKDMMIPTVNSFVAQQVLPNAYLKVFPDSGHGFLYQFAAEFAEDVNGFLDDSKGATKL